MKLLSKPMLHQITLRIVNERGVYHHSDEELTRTKSVGNKKRRFRKKENLQSIWASSLKNTSKQRSWTKTKITEECRIK